jgi:hypothetical protein
MVEIWASDTTFTMEVDDAEFPEECSCAGADDAKLANHPTAKYVFQLECVSTCPEPCAADASGRMLMPRSEF